MKTTIIMVITSSQELPIDLPQKEADPTFAIPGMWYPLSRPVLSNWLTESFG